MPLTSLLPAALSADHRVQERIGFIGAVNNYVKALRHTFQISADNAHDAAIRTRLAEGSDKNLSPPFRYGVAEQEHPATLMPHEGLSQRHAARTRNLEPA
jgi:hypothetical protein